MRSLCQKDDNKRATKQKGKKEKDAEKNHSQVE